MYYPSGKAKIFALITMLVAWAALVLQLYLFIQQAPGNKITVAETIGRYFTYFTILSNLLVALGLTFILFLPGSLTRFFSRISTQTAIAVYIFVVGLGYNFLLRHLWNPQGWQRIADELLHVAVPALYFLYWIIFVPGAALKWKNVFTWLLYPLIYTAVALLRGNIDGFYPYYFVDVKKLGYTAVGKNLIGLFVVLIVMNFLFIAISRWKKKKR
ncbi:MAG: Pr6Pr family membrane protein [Chitinophagaceae bacterium]